MSAQEDVTTGELGRRFDRFEKTITETLGTVVTKLDERPDWKDVRNIEASIVERVKKLEDWQTWALRLGGPVVVAIGVGIANNAMRIAGN